LSTSSDQADLSQPNVAATLLLADDSVTVQRVVALMFAGEDVDVVAVGDGEQAIAHLDAHPIDIVLAEVAMPGKGGYEIAAYIRQAPKLAHIPVLLLTGAFEPIDPQKAAEVGCDAVLTKPFEPEIVVNQVKGLLTRGRGSLADSKENAGPPSSALPDSGTRNPDSLSLGDFFDRLDAAFANLPASGRDPVSALSAPQPAATVTSPPLTDELVERVAARVLERLSGEHVREIVADLVSTIAERLVREEIERIKASIR
jgi:CheY-like chemotaxis protein